VLTATAPRANAPSPGRELLRDYSAFGGVLRSEIEFPELEIAGGGTRPDWTLLVERSRPSPRGLTPLGERQVGAERYRLWRAPEGLRLEHSHAGTFDLSGDGRCIRWYHERQAMPELVRNIVLGPAIALALELAGFLCLHGSAVSLGGRAAAFLAPKYFGKSTLATALTAAGGGLLGDDLLVVSAGPPATVRPGVASVRLWADAAAALPLDAISKTLISGVKTTVTGFRDDALARTPTAFGDIYLLSPVMGDAASTPVSRTRLSPVEGAIALARHTKLPDSLVGLRAAGSQLATAAKVAATVPVWRLHVVRDMSRLEVIVRQLIEWSFGNEQR
jgi:hypothetical protein